LDFKEYQEVVCEKIDKTYSSNLSTFTMELMGEAGEVSKLVNKYIYEGKQMSRKEFAIELGHVLESIVKLGRIKSITLEDIAKASIETLDHW